MRGMLDLADAFVSPSRFLAERYAEWGIEADKLSVIENGIAMGEAHARTRASAVPTPAGTASPISDRLTPFKGVDVLIDAVSRVPEEIWGDDACLMIFGGNLERQPLDFQERLKKLIDDAGRRVRFYGAYQNADMPRLIRSVDWVVMPSTWWENSPLVIQEALLHRRPIICSDIGGMAEKVRDGKDGLHFRAGSAQDLADRIAEVLRAIPKPGTGCGPRCDNRRATRLRPRTCRTLPSAAASGSWRRLQSRASLLPQAR